MRTDPGDIMVWGCSIAAMTLVACATVAALAGTYAFVTWCFS